MLDRSNIPWFWDSLIILLPTVDQQKDSSFDLKQMTRTSCSLKKLIDLSEECFSKRMIKDYFACTSTETMGELSSCSEI